MDFSASFQDSEKRKMGIVIFFFTLIFILSIVWAVWLRISVKSEVILLIWFADCFLGMFEILLLLRWQDGRTWMIAKKKNTVSYRNRFGTIKEFLNFKMKIRKNSFGACGNFEFTGGI